MAKLRDPLQIRSSSPGIIVDLAVLYCARQLSRNRRGDCMRRREFLTLLGGTAAAWPLSSRAQQRKAMPRVGVLWHAANAREEAEYLGALTKAFHELGYFEGKSIEMEHRFPAEQPERYRALAHELAE